MSYQAEVTRLQRIIIADESTDAQRSAARKARDKLIDSSIEEAFKSFQDRTQEFNVLVGQLKGVVDKIAANQLDGVIESLNGVVSDIQKAAADKPGTG